MPKTGRATNTSASALSGRRRAGRPLAARSATGQGWADRPWSEKEEPNFVSHDSLTAASAMKHIVRGLTFGALKD